MKRPEKRLNATETLEILNNQWATMQDIQKLAFVGENKAGEIAKDITNIVLERTKKTLPKGLYPMEIVQEYLGININYLKKVERG